MYAVSDYTSGYHFPPSLLSAQRFLYFVQMSDVTKHEYLVATPPSPCGINNAGTGYQNPAPALLIVILFSTQINSLSALQT